MKTLRFIGMTLIAVIASVHFVACSDDNSNGNDDTVIEKLVVHVPNAGNLEALIDVKQRYKIQELVLSGYLNGIDITYILETFKEDCKLKRLDLTDVQMLGGKFTAFNGDECTFSRNEIGDKMFSQVISLESVKLPNSITRIGNYAFSFSGLTSLEIPNSVTEIGSRAFIDTRITSIAISKNIIKIGRQAFNLCLEMSKITVAADNLYYSSNDDILFNKEKNVLVYYPANKAGNSYTIAENVSAISPDAFNSCANLTSIVIPNSVTQIGNGAFSRAGISTMTIPKSVIEIGHCAFGGGALKEIHFLNNTPPQLIDDSEGEDRMYYCDSFGFDNCNIYVPKGSYETYKASYAFKQYDNIIEE